MDNNELINHVSRNNNRIEVGNSQLDIIIQYINEYFSKSNNPNKKKLIAYLAQNNEFLELGNSQFEILADVINEYEKI